MNRYLHIVCLDAPYPADCGNSIDMMNRIKAFHKKGVKIHLHYFKFKDSCGCSTHLKTYCETVQVYPKNERRNGWSLNVPKMIHLRYSQELIDNINKDGHPVLLEGLHTTGVLRDISQNGRKICIRMHNEEAAYYRELARHTSHPLKKIYYRAESSLIKKYTNALPKDHMYACASNEDATYLKNHHFLKVAYVPVFPSWQKVDAQTGVGSLCLFHGRLSVPENEKAALWLLSNVFNKVRVPFIIAGKDPGKSLQKAASLCQNTCLVSNPCDSEMSDLIQKAHINVLPSFNKNTTGIRLKLLHALFKGRHCVATPAMVSGTGLEAACHIGSNANGIASIIAQLYYRPFEEEEIQLRQSLLCSTYDNEKNVDQFINYLW